MNIVQNDPQSTVRTPAFVREDPPSVDVGFSRATTITETPPNMAKSAVKWLIIATLTIGTNPVVLAQDTDLGISLYRLGCAVCHGIDGKGKGPLSEQLKAAPPDLTVLAKKNNGVFPVSYVYEIIDGRKVIAAHGTREMPIWGAYDRPSLYPQDKLLDSSYDPEAVVRTRTLYIIDYLNRIQEK